jgi:hypothetical protein
MANAGRQVRIGGASGFWGDSALGAQQLVEVPGMRYITFDYLAELTMSIMAGAKAKKPELGYATDFVEVAVRGSLKACVERGIRLVSNAGGINPRACAAAVRQVAAELGVPVRVAVVDGDDVMPLLPAMREQGVRDFYTGEAMPERIGSANAYLGAIPIARALAGGADVVITGRVVDSAVVLAVLMHEFGWSADDHDRLAAGSLAGHIIECGCQATGGLHTDWESVPDWDTIGYPVIDCSADGSFVVSKPEGSGGLVSVATVAEQMLYEIGDPAAYVLPDVVCDFTGVSIEQVGPHRVRVSGARGLAPTDRYKVSATFMDGFACAGTLTIVGFDAVAKARRSGEAVIARTRRMLQQAGLPDFSAVNLEVIGAEQPFGAHARRYDQREAVVRIAVRHPMKAALERFAREIAPAGTSWSPGTTGGMSPGRPAVSPRIRLFSFTIPKSMVTNRVTLDDGDTVTVAVPAGVPPEQSPATRAGGTPPLPAPYGAAPPPVGPDEVEVPLVRIAWARSGDKGDTSNIGVIARSPALLPYLLREVTEARVHDYLSHYVRGTVTRHPVPGIHAVNLVMTQALGGGGMASLRYDPLGKGMAQILLSMPVRVPAALAGVGRTA